MTIASAQAQKFYEQVAREDSVFTFTHDGDFLVFPIRDIEVVPFWSSLSRMNKIRATHQKYASYSITRSTLDEFLTETLPMLQKEDLHVGVNWSGPRLVGYDISVADLKRNVEHALRAIRK